MPCCDGWDFEAEGEVVNGECPDCEGPTIEGTAVRGCNYSPIICPTCGDAPCDLSC